MSKDLIEQVVRKIGQVNNLYYRLLLLVGEHGSGKTSLLKQVKGVTSAPLVNVNLELSRELLNLTCRQRALQLPQILGDVVNSFESNTLLLDNTEILFDVSLQHDPLALLQKISRNKTIVATWNGTLTENHVLYAEPWHPEYRRYSLLGLVVVDLQGMNIDKNIKV